MKKLVYFTAIFLSLTACTKKMDPCSCAENSALINMDTEMESNCNSYVSTLSDQESIEWINKAMFCFQNQGNEKSPD